MEHLVLNADPAVGDLAQMVLAQEEEDMGPFAPVVLYLMSLDKNQNILIENIIFGSALALTLLSAKVNFDKLQQDNAEKEELQKQAIKNAINPDKEWRSEVRKMDERESKGFSGPTLEEARAKRRVRGVRREGSGKTAMDELSSMEGN